MSKMQSARMNALARLSSKYDSMEVEGMKKPFGDAGDTNPLEKSGYEGEVTPAKYFAEGGLIAEEMEGAPQAEMGSGNHDETSPDMFASAWEELTGKKWRRHEDQYGLGGDSQDDGSGVDAASEGGEDDDEKPRGKR